MHTQVGMHAHDRAPLTLIELSYRSYTRLDRSEPALLPVAFTMGNEMREQHDFPGARREPLESNLRRMIREKLEDAAARGRTTLSSSCA